jgi:hypothetical protein
VPPAVAPAREPERPTAAVVANYVEAVVGHGGGGPLAPCPDACVIHVLQDLEEGAPDGRAGGHREAPVVGLRAARPRSAPFQVVLLRGCALE